MVSCEECKKEYRKLLKKMGIGGKKGCRFHPIKKFHFKSKSRPGVKYTTQINSDGSVTCDCPGWVFKKKGKERGCSHTILVQTRMYKQ